jgi:hypothetical protein
MGAFLANVGTAVVGAVLYLAAVVAGTAIVTAVATYTAHAVWYW